MSYEPNLYIGSLSYTPTFHCSNCSIYNVLSLAEVLIVSDGTNIQWKFRTDKRKLEDGTNSLFILSMKISLKEKSGTVR